MNKEKQRDWLSKRELNEILTGPYESIEDIPVISRMTDTPLQVRIDVSIKGERDRAYRLVQMMKRKYAAPEHPLRDYYARDFAAIEEAYADKNPELFRKALQGLVNAIHAE